MPVALIDFECEYDGQIVRLEAGRDWVAPGHELVDRYRDRFGQLNVGLRGHEAAR